ncbi:MAG: FAD-binding oxidoreductase [Verrucomicrobiota bacterium]
MTFRFLIVGQGLAGSSFACEAVARGHRVLLVDPSPEDNASHIAAGMINPILGQRLNLSWRFETLFPLAEQFYAAHAPSAWHPIPLVRWFRHEEQQQRWLSKRDSKELRSHWTPYSGAPHSAFRCPGAAWLSTQTFLQTTSRHLPIRRSLLDPSSLQVREDEIRWGEVSADYVVFAEGSGALRNPWFSRLPLRMAKGEILDLELESFSLSEIHSGEKWILPLPDQGSFRAGSTYNWEDPSPVPTSQANFEILEGTRRFLPTGQTPRVRQQSAGHRPMLDRGRPVIGPHPNEPRFLLINGLGAKGALLAPFVAKELMDHLETKRPIDPEIAIHRFPL